MLPIDMRRMVYTRAENFMSRTIRSKFLLLALALVVWPVYSQETTPAPAPAPAAEKATRQTEAQPAEAKDDEEKPSKTKKDNDKPLAQDQVRNPVMWEDPGDIASRNLFWGQGGEKH